MKIKHRFSDFRVTEVLRSGFVQEKGSFSVYRVTKRKLSTPEAVRELAELCDVDPAEVSVAGLKDRQGITVQHMSVPARRPLRLKRPDLRIEHIGFSDQELSSTDSGGNSFELTVRAVEIHELSIFKKNIAPVREHGIPNYFDEQRFGNLRHEQGWIARELMLGRAEDALKAFLCAPSPFDDEKNRAFKSAMHGAWGDWRVCRDIAGRFGSHHSVFEHLGANPQDFSGAFFRVASRLRLIHLYAFQSHVWNRALAERVRECVESDSRVRVPSVEGPLVFFDGEPPQALLDGGLPLPGASLEGVEFKADRELFARVLEAEGLTPETFRIDGVPGFQLKPEPRPLIVLPRHLRVRPAVPDSDHPGLSAVVLRFELPRGAYATLVVKRLFARSRDARSRADVFEKKAKSLEYPTHAKHAGAGAGYGSCGPSGASGGSKRFGHAGAPSHSNRERREGDSRSYGSRGNDSRSYGSRGNDSRSYGSRGNDSRGNDSRSYGSRGNDSRGNDSRSYGSRGNDSRSYGSRGNDSRSYGSRGNDSRSYGSQGNDSRGYGSRGSDSRGNDSRSYGSRGNDSRGNDSRSYGSRGNDSRSYGSRGNDSRSYGSRGNDSRGNDSRSYGSRGNDSRSYGSRGNDSRGQHWKGADDRRGGRPGGERSGSGAWGKPSGASSGARSESRHGDRSHDYRGGSGRSQPYSDRGGRQGFQKRGEQPAQDRFSGSTSHGGSPAERPSGAGAWKKTSHSGAAEPSQNKSPWASAKKTRESNPASTETHAKKDDQ